jgi:transposase
VFIHGLKCFFISHTYQLSGANSFDYLTDLQQHARELVANPEVWMPWNYCETLERAGA